jgi:hypothetical protein
MENALTSVYGFLKNYVGGSKMLQGDGLQGEVRIIRGIKTACGVKKSVGVRERRVNEL